MKLPLAYYGNPILRKKAARIDEITDEIRQLAEDMRESMHAYNGIGLAAPQVNRSLALFVMEVPRKVSEDPEDDTWEPGPFYVFINPTILGYSSEQWNRGEGCISIPGLYGEVTRPVVIRVQATDLNGNRFEQEFSWLEARCIMHENDHINGVLFIDRIHGKERKKIDAELNQIKKKFHLAQHS